MVTEVLLSLFVLGVAGQQIPGGGYYNEHGIRVNPSSSRNRDRDPQNNRNRWPYDYTNYNRPGYGQRDPYDRPEYDVSNPYGVPQPGILAGWREDLQGKLRPESETLDKFVYVDTTKGQIQGFKVYLYDNPDPLSSYRPGLTPVERIQGNVSVFLGIPYAEPPINEGRFKPPRVHRGFALWQAVDFGPACPQPIQYIGATKNIREVNEDCLYLNVYSPTTASGRAQLFPVMFYIHGGDFLRGASNLFPAHILAGFYDVVVVSFNYRLGLLGFLSTADEQSPGNYGILDQALALQWVYENIQFFNGDKNAITVFGPGAGAASAGLLMVAPRTRNMIDKIIAQSGSATADWALIIDRYRAQNTSRVFAQNLGCGIDSSVRIVNCLRKGRTYIELGNANTQPQVGILPWAPILDGSFRVPEDGWYEGWKEADWHFLSSTPEELIKRGEFNRKIKYMTGVTTQEAAYLIYNNDTLAPFYEVNQKFFDQKIHELVLKYNYTLNPNGVFEAIKYMYTHWPDPNNTDIIRDRYIDLMSDFFYRAPTDQIVKLLVNQDVPVYMYVLNTTIEAFRYPEWRKVSHDTEYYFLTGAPFMDVEFFPRKPSLSRTMWTDNDRNMSHFFMKSYANFARYGHPTYTQILGLHFEVATKGYLKYLNLNTTFNSSILFNYRQTEAAFWTKYLPTVIGHLLPTYPPYLEEWWEPKEPLQIAFWSVSVACLLLIVLVVICCILWRNAKRQSDRYFGEDIMLRQDMNELNGGIENHSASNVYEYKDTPPPKSRRQGNNVKETVSAPASRVGSAVSLKDSVSFHTSSPNVEQRKPTPVPAVRKPKTQLSEGGVPQTQV